MKAVERGLRVAREEMPMKRGWVCGRRSVRRDRDGEGTSEGVRGGWMAEGVGGGSVALGRRLVHR